MWASNCRGWRNSAARSHVAVTGTEQTASNPVPQIGQMPNSSRHVWFFDPFPIWVSSFGKLSGQVPASVAKTATSIWIGICNPIGPTDFSAGWSRIRLLEYSVCSQDLLFVISCLLFLRLCSPCIHQHLFACRCLVESLVKMKTACPRSSPPPAPLNFEATTRHFTKFIHLRSATTARFLVTTPWPSD